MKNYSNNDFAYPQIFVQPYDSFYNVDSFYISHSYFNRHLIKKPSFPFMPSHFDYLKSIIDNNNEEIYFNGECEFIKKTKIICGNIIVNKNFLYFKNNDNIIKEYGKDIKYLFGSYKGDISITNKIILIKIKDIKEIISRRYLYDYRAFEIFLKDGKSYYFNLYSKKSLLYFYEEIEKLKNEENDFIVIKEPITFFIHNRFKEDWIDNKISTYQYLLFINKFASRSFNDINQYPIFPWIFLSSKHDSYKKKETLPSFRELAYPMSIKKDEDKLDALMFYDSSYQEKPKYPAHYRLHYSTSGYLITYLVRISPFTEEQIRFQNNQFDSPSRQINSIDEILHILESSHDNRELIPEYFTSMEFLLNSNYVNFGYRLNDKVMINDIQCPDKYFNSISQYIYFNRLMLNIKSHYEQINIPAFKQELKISEWIDLIFGCDQWDEIPKRNKFNIFGKYSYKQNINFNNILEKYEEKGYDNKKIINKIEGKKSKIINFGQCPEVLFKSKHEESILPLTKEQREKDEIDISDTIINTINIKKYEEKMKTKFNIATFWLDKEKDNSYIYFLVFEEIKENNENIKNDKQYIFIYKNESRDKIEPDFIINLNEINLFNIKVKIKIDNKKNDNNDNITKKSSTSKEKDIIKFIENSERYPSEDENENENFKNDLKNELLLSSKTSKFTKSLKFREKNNEKNNINYIHYKISPKESLFDICLENKIYFFVGRNIDNSIKIYEQEIKKGKNAKLKYNIPTETFVSCLHKKDEYLFFSGHKNGKLLEWKISYSEDKNKKEDSIIKIEIIRDIIAHRESMISCIYYIKKHNIILTSSNDGKLFVRKYFDFELLSIIEPKQKNTIISKIIYTNYDLLYLLINHKDRKYSYKYRINVFTVNGLFIESSSSSYIIDIEPLKNGKILCNDINSENLLIFGLNRKLGRFNEYDIQAKMQLKKQRIINFIYQHNMNSFYFLLEDKILYRQQLPDFEFLEKGVDKLLGIYQNNSETNNKETPKKIFTSNSKKEIKRFESL